MDGVFFVVFSFFFLIFCISRFLLVAAKAIVMRASIFFHKFIQWRVAILGVQVENGFQGFRGLLPFFLRYLLVKVLLHSTTGLFACAGVGWIDAGYAEVVAQRSPPRMKSFTSSSNAAGSISGSSSVVSEAILGFFVCWMFKRNQRAATGT